MKNRKKYPKIQSNFYESIYTRFAWDEETVNLLEQWKSKFQKEEIGIREQTDVDTEKIAIAIFTEDMNAGLISLFAYRPFSDRVYLLQ